MKTLVAGIFGGLLWTIAALLMFAGLWIAALPVCCLGFMCAMSANR
jgi:hypothetical protein